MEGRREYAEDLVDGLNLEGKEEDEETDGGSQTVVKGREEEEKD